MKLTMRRAAVATAGVVAAGGLVLGGTEAFASSPAPAMSASTSASPSATGAPKAGCMQGWPKKAGQRAKTGKAPKPNKMPKRPRGCAGGGFGGGFGGRGRGPMFNLGVHGQATIKGANGGFTVQEWQTGKVASINGGVITVTDASGTTWTWTVQSSTRYRVAGAAGSLSGVHTGDTVTVTGVQNGSANDVTALSDPGQSKPAPSGSHA
jgi:hypothetical protein